MVDTSDNSVHFELDAEGLSSGVEREDIGYVLTDPFDPRLIDVVTEVRSLDVLLKRMKAKQIDLDPDFQRSRGIWTARKKSLLIESLLLRIPLPTFYAAEVAGEELGDNHWAIVDGIQRLSTIAEFIDPSLLGDGARALRLEQLDYLELANGRTYDQLPPSLQLRLLESQFTVQVIRRRTPEAVKLNIFARINTGGVPLSAQELRHALTPGPARATLKEFASSGEFRLAVDDSVSPSRMNDREMVLRFVAFASIDTSAYEEVDFDKFLRRTMEEMNGWSSSEKDRWAGRFSNAMSLAEAVFGNDAFRKRYDPAEPRKPISKALFEAVSVSLDRAAENYGRDLIVSRSNTIRSGFLSLMHDQKFDRSVSQGTSDPVRVRDRFSGMWNLLCSSLED